MNALCVIDPMLHPLLTSATEPENCGHSVLVQVTHKITYFLPSPTNTLKEPSTSILTVTTVPAGTENTRGSVMQGLTALRDTITPALPPLQAAPSPRPQPG